MGIRMEQVEMALIVAAVLATAVLAVDLVWLVPFAHLTGYVAALLLGQGLLRDVARLVVRRLQRAEAQTPRRIFCLCAESSLGLLLIGLAGGLTLLGITQEVVVARWGLTGLVGGVLVVGFVAKDYVIHVRKEKDHGSIIVW